MSEVQALSVYALTPREIGPAQAQLAGWCHQKMRSLGKDYAELRSNLRVATRNRWSRGGLQKAVSLTKRRIQYYKKIESALNAGFLIIPNLPIDVIAIRTDRACPPYQTGEYPSDVNTAQADILPQGEGRYVDEMTRVRDMSHINAEGKRVRLVEAGQFSEEIDFPVLAVKPQIMEATAQAMTLKLFDRIGLAHNNAANSSRRIRRSDPFVVGQILNPQGGHNTWHPKLVTFFIAWWLDTSAL